MVWDVIAMDEAWWITGRRPLKGRLVDSRKGCPGGHGARCRWVATEAAYRHSVQRFAATPPLEAPRFRMSEVATRGPSTGVSWRGGPARRRMLFLVAKKAHLRAPSVRAVCAELPPERARAGH